jgi:hypothetical protein
LAAKLTGSTPVLLFTNGALLRGEDGIELLLPLLHLLASRLLHRPVLGREALAELPELLSLRIRQLESPPPAAALGGGGGVLRRQWGRHERRQYQQGDRRSHGPSPMRQGWAAHREDGRPVPLLTERGDSGLVTQA